MGKLSMSNIFSFFKTKGVESEGKRENLTSAEYEDLKKSFKEEFGVELKEGLMQAKQNDENEKKMSQEMTEVFSILDEVKANASEETKEEETKAETGDQKKEVKATVEDRDIKAEVTQLVNVNKELKTKVEKLEAAYDKPNPQKVKGKIVPINNARHSDKHLFGIENDLFAIGENKPWNLVAKYRRPLEVLGSDGLANGNWASHTDAFQKEFESYAKKFAGRVNELQANGELSQIKMADLDFTGFDGTGWGDEYVVRRQDAIIAYIRSLPSVRNLFPVRYGVQNKMVMTNSFLTDFSQAYQSGEVFKGSHEFKPMEAEVFDVMMKHQFTNLKKMEKEYIGYLNREGSDPMKWSMIEWLMVQTMKKLNNEWNERRIKGYRIEPTTDVAGHHMFGSDGVVRQLFKYVENNYIAPFSDLKTYTSSTILTFIESFLGYVNEILPAGLNGYYLYVNIKHQPWFRAAYRAEYGTDFDFKGEKYEIPEYDGLSGIKWVPNMGNSKLMFVAQEGNIELYEDQPGEMLSIYFERRLENLIAASWWKEGAGAYMVGKKYASQAEIIAANRAEQYIFMTNPVVDLAADATTADATAGDRFVTIANTGATVLTDITGAKEGVVYRVETGSTTNATTIAKSGKFSEISAAWTPTAVGDFLEVYYDAATSKFKEVRRQVT